MDSSYLVIAGYLLGLGVIIHAMYSFFRKPSPEAAGPYHVPWRPFESVTITIATYIASSVLAVFMLYGILGGSIESGNLTEDSTLLNFVYLLLFEAITVGFLYMFLRLRKARWSSLGIRRPKPSDLGYALLGFVAYFAILVSVEQFLPWVDFDQKQELGFSTSVAGAELAVIFLCLVIIVPIVEEILMRGFLFAGLRSRLSLLPAAFITCLLFGLAHLQPESGKPLLWAAAVDTFVLSVVLVALRVKTDGIISPILLHMLKNSIAFTFLFVLHV